MTRGQVPKRSSERIRRNKENEVEQIPTIAEAIQAPDLGLEDPHPMISDFYESLKESGQAQYYEPSDWQFARFTLYFADQLIKSSKPSSVMLTAINSALSNLLVTEGDRRRVRMEVEREQAQAEVYDVADLFYEELTKS